MKLIMTLIVVLFAGTASAGTIERLNMPVNSGSAYAYTIDCPANVNGRAYLTTAAILKDRAPATENTVIIADGLDIYDTDAVVDYVAAYCGETVTNRDNGSDHGGDVIEPSDDEELES